MVQVLVRVLLDLCRLLRWRMMAKHMGRGETDEEEQGPGEEEKA
jgi:hypothetical protein